MPAQRPERPDPGHAMLLPRVSQDDDTQRALQAVAPKMQQLQRSVGDLTTQIANISAGTGGMVTITGTVGNGTTDDTAAIQAAIDANPGRLLYLPKGKYSVSTLFIKQTSTRLFGDFGNRAADGGTELSFTGTGPCIQIGIDDGNAWDAAEYNGKQDQQFENLWISHAAPDSTLASAPGAGNVYKAGAYGIWDWRGGGIRMKNCGIERFEASFAGVNSDINCFEFCLNLYSKYGWYLGPRSDQNTIRDMYSFFCDRCITIDRAGQTRIQSSQFVFCGTNTASSIEVRQGSHGVAIHNSWFERSGSGYQGTDALSFVSAGEVAGYGAGGSIQAPGGAPTTTSVQGLSIDRAHCYSVLGGVASHTRYLVSVGKCTGLLVDHPSEYINSSLSNFDAIAGVQASLSPSNADTQIEVRGIDSGTPIAKLFQNLGGGNPNFTARTSGTIGPHWWTNNNSAFSFRDVTGAAGADRLDLAQQGNVGHIWMTTPNKPSAQTVRFHLSRSWQHGSAAPVAGTYEVGDITWNDAPAAGGFIGWVCTSAGTPGTWKTFGAISP